ncbi:MAG: TrkA family potassium uptake protein [Syntrophobacteraceae bacterium]
MSDSRTSPPTAQILLVDIPIARMLLQRLVLPFSALVLTFLFGTGGFLVIGNGRWTVLDCAYMTSITLTTVGYGETLDQMGNDARVFAMVLMWLGMGVTLYAVSTITAFLVETDLRRILRERRMEKKLQGIKGHYIVCGLGKTGFNIVQELYTTRQPCVAIDASPEHLQRTQKHFEELYYLLGDATEEEILTRAGVERAAGVIAALKDDSDNLLITVQARYISPTIKIVARCNENNLTDKFYRAGANYVVNPAFIGGMRMASEMVRPHVVTFLDRMLRGRDQSVRVEEATVREDSPWVGKTLREIDIRRQTGLLLVALKHPDAEDFRYNPEPGEHLHAGSVIIVIGNSEQVATLRGLCTGC